MEGHWRCEICKQTIDSGEEGLVVLQYDKKFDYRQGKGGALGPSSVTPRVFHEHCGLDVSTELNEYDFSVARVWTLERWVEQVVQLLPKTWMGKRETANLLRFWWSHKGEPIPNLNFLHEDS